ncbi:12634_t:CDS:2, partial [Cetraspora pellucida]
KITSAYVGRGVIRSNSDEYSSILIPTHIQIERITQEKSGLYGLQENPDFERYSDCRSTDHISI